MSYQLTNTEQPGINHMGMSQNSFYKFEDVYDTQNHVQNYFVDSNQVNSDSYSYERYNSYTNTPDAWNSSTASNYNLYSNPSPIYQHPPTSTTNVPVRQGSEETGSWSTSVNGFIEQRLDDAIGVLQKHAEGCNYSPQIGCTMPIFSNADQSFTISGTSSNIQPHVPNNSKEDIKPVKAIRKKKTNRKKEVNNNKKSASGYAHFFRERQPRIKEENKSASFGDISKIVASEWEALSIDEKAVYKRKAEDAKNDKFKDIALTHAMTVAGANLPNNNTDNQIVIKKEIPMAQNNVQGSIGSMITYQHSQQQQQQQQHHHQQQQQQAHHHHHHQQQQAHLIHHTHQQQQHLEANYNPGLNNHIY